MDLKTHLQQLYEEHQSNLAPYSWASESARWAELVFCLLHQCSDGEPEATRAAVIMLQNLGILDIEKLVCLDNPANEITITLVYILNQHAFSEAATQRAVKVLFQLSKVVKTRYNGKIQSYLRLHGQIMRDELISACGDLMLSDEQLQYAIVHWLQNSLSLPIPLESKTVREFLEKNDASMDELLRACDDLDMNVAIADDLLELNYNISSAIAENIAIKKS